MPSSIDSEEAREVRKYFYFAVNCIVTIIGVPTFIFLFISAIYSIYMIKKALSNSNSRVSVQKRDGFLFKIYVLVFCMLSIFVEVSSRIFQISVINNFNLKYAWKITYSLSILSDSLYAAATIRIVLFGLQLTFTILKQGFMRNSRVVFNIFLLVSLFIQFCIVATLITLSCIFCETRYQYVIVLYVHTFCVGSILGIMLLCLIVIFYRYSKKLPKSNSLIRLMVLSIIVCLSFLGLFFTYLSQFIISLIASVVPYVKFLLPIMDFANRVFVYSIPIILIGLFTCTGSKNVYKKTKRFSSSSSRTNLNEGLMDSDYRKLQNEVDGEE
mmetsp:Transcript_13981/g.21159  ORF Transcript_13981/g.21159 Transcript_13981/m.21159 type:complete len:327 (+) Transcript_13981:39-1019(+)